MILKDIRSLVPPPDYSRMLVGSLNGTLHLIPYVEPNPGKSQIRIKKIVDFHSGAVTGTKSKQKYIFICK